MRYYFIIVTYTILRLLSHQLTMQILRMLRHILIRWSQDWCWNSQQNIEEYLKRIIKIIFFLYTYRLQLLLPNLALYFCFWFVCFLKRYDIKTIFNVRKKEQSVKSFINFITSITISKWRERLDYNFNGRYQPGAKQFSLNSKTDTV